MYRITIKKETYREIAKMGKLYRIQWDKKPIMVTGYDEEGNPTGEHEDPYYVSCMEETYSYKPELDELKTLINGYINDKINGEIVTGFTYVPESGVTLHPYLSNENQLNYKNAFDLMKDATTVQYILPYRIKNSNGYEPRYYDFTTLSAFKAFYLSIMQHIQSKLNEAWTIKDGIDWSKYEIDTTVEETYGTSMEMSSIYSDDFTGMSGTTDASLETATDAESDDMEDADVTPNEGTATKRTVKKKTVVTGDDVTD